MDTQDGVEAGTSQSLSRCKKGHMMNSYITDPDEEAIANLSSMMWSFTIKPKIASLGRQEPQPAGKIKWATTLRFGKIWEQHQL